MLIRSGVRLDGRTVDIRVEATVVEVGARLAVRPGEEVIDARGNLVLPGLHDHHLHLRATAAALDSVPVGPPRVRDRGEFVAALRRARPDPDGWIRAVGYHDSVAGELTRDILDAAAPENPVRVQHRSGALWVLNSAALRRVGAADHADGRFLRGDPLPEPPRREPSLDALGELLVARGVTGVTDATPGQGAHDLDGIAAQRRSGRFRPRVHCLAPAGLSAPEGLSVGPAKRILDDHSLDLAELQDWVAANHAEDHPVAVHCVTDAQLVVVLAALRAVGAHPGDRVEHAAMVPDDCVEDLADLGVTVVTQPNFVAERGDEYRAELPAAELDRLWRVGTLVAAGVRVALSTDAPFGVADPWAAMRAAVRRRAPSGALIGPRERISPDTALSMFLGRADEPARPRILAPGEPGDVCVLSGPPAAVLGELDAGMVAATVVGGRVCYRR